MDARSIEIRPAELEDVDAIVRFNARMAVETEDTHLDTTVLQEGVRLLLNDPGKGRYFLACDNQKPVGQIMHTYEWSDWRCGFIWWIQSVYVEETHRGHGIYRMLHEYLARQAQAEGAVGLRLYVEEDNHRAHAVYDRVGMKRAGYFVLQDMFVGPGSRQGDRNSSTA